MLYVFFFFSCLQEWLHNNSMPDYRVIINRVSIHRFSTSSSTHRTDIQEEVNNNQWMSISLQSPRLKASPPRKATTTTTGRPRYHDIIHCVHDTLVLTRTLPHVVICNYASLMSDPLRLYYYYYYEQQTGQHYHHHLHPHPLVLPRVSGKLTGTFATANANGLIMVQRDQIAPELLTTLTSAAPVLRHLPRHHPSPPN